MIFLLSLRKELRGQWRSGRMLVMLAILVFFGLSSPLLAKFTPDMLALIPGASQFSQLVPTPTMADAVAQYIKNASQFGIILALVLAMGAVAIEKDKGTAALLLVKPLPRATFILAKFAALAIGFALSLVIGALGAWYYTVLLFGVLPLGAFMALNGLLWLQVLVYLAVTIFFSTLSRSQAVAAGLGVAFLLFLSLLGAFPGLRPLLPDNLLAWGVGLTLGQPIQPAWGALAVSLGLIAAALLGACRLLRRQEL
jgi:ABC-2 type transport system permease protein